MIPMNEFLKSRQDVDIATQYLQDNGLVESGLSCKNWEVAQVIPYMKEGNWIDLGSNGSVVIENLIAKQVKGIKVGIDLAYTENKTLPNGVDLIKGDLINAPFPDSYFDFITCLSVIEHSVNVESLAKECNRLLSNGGQVFLSADYWNPKPDTSKMRLYSLDWNVLDKNDILNLVRAFKDNRLHITSDIDWVLHDAVINDQFCSPAAGVSYTFGIFHFIKQ